MTPVTILAAGPTAWLIELEVGAPVHALAAHLAGLRDAGGLPGVADVVPGARTVLLDGDRRLDRVLLDRTLAGWDPGSARPAEAPLAEIPVAYDGDDLGEVARLAGLTPAEVAEAHSGAAYVVAFCGFSAGFAYLTGLPDVLRLPRLEVPRTAVPAGAVGIAEEYSAVYPRRSPGGWRLLGRTARPMWDETADPPALLAPGTRVRFVAGG